MNDDHNRNHAPDRDDELAQAMLELHYGLLDDDEAKALKHEIETNPVAAKQWADTLLVASKFAAAAKIDAPSEAGWILGQSDANSRPTEKPIAPAPATSDRFLSIWIGSLATAALLAVLVSGYRYQTRLPESPNGQLRVAVQSVSGDRSAARNEFLVAVGPREVDAVMESATTAASLDTSLQFVPASISFKVLSKGAVLFFGSAQTSASQAARIRVPDDVAIPGDAILQVEASAQGRGDLVRLSVPLEPTRCLTYVSTDRPVYRPGETIYFRSVTLNRRTLAAHLEVPIRYELVDASGATVPGALVEGVTERGVGNGAFAIPESVAGGSYQLKAISLDGFFPDQNCEIEVRQYRAVRFKAELEFSKRSFGAGDSVEASLVARRADDSSLAAAAARVTAVVDGQLVYETATNLDINGELAISFSLPKTIRNGEGTLAIALDDGSGSETTARPIPIHTGRAQVDFYPEGGYLVGGLNNRVYFAARDIAGKPIDLAGEILSQSGRTVALVETVRDGMGRFEFKPESGQRYSLRITSPLDVTETPWLPSVVEALPVLDTGSSVFEPATPISLTLRSTVRRTCIVRMVCRGELIGVKTIEIGIGDTAISVPIQQRAAGVIRVTVLDAEGETALPLVERLVFRKSDQVLQVVATVDDERQTHSPGESVRMTIAVTDENNQPVAGAVLGVNVVDDAALSLRQHELPSIKTHFLLTSEIESPADLEHADFYLADSEDAAQSLDLLLGTQGWRRFVSGTANEYDETFREALTRLLELDGKREGLINENAVASNDSAFTERLHDYVRRSSAAWDTFVAEIRFALILIGALWLVGFLLRPRKPTVVAAGLLLLIVSLVIQSGCGGGQVNSVIPANEFENDESMKYGDQMMKPMASADSSGAMAGSEPNSFAPTLSAPAEPPFVERVVRVFLGQRGGQSASDDLTLARLTPEQLDRWSRSRGVDAKTRADQLMEELRFPIRQYAHVHRDSGDGLRSDFSETLYWNPLMVTDSSGTATIRFDLSDAVTMYRVNVDAHASGGRLGSGDGAVRTNVPIEVAPKLPLEVTGGDRIDLPIGLVNGTNDDGIMEVSLQLTGPLAAEQLQSMTSVAAGSRALSMLPIRVASVTGAVDVPVRIITSFADGALTDSVEKSLRVVPDGFPFETTQSGNLAGTTEITAKVPDHITEDSLHGSLRFYPSTQSQLSAGLESILQEPHGCFEQASSSNYPNVMAFQLMQLEGSVDERSRSRTLSLLRRGYRKLTSYECSTLGYEWFGNDPGHEALSAFGLMQFSEMSQYIDIDTDMLQRTRQWLLSRRDGKGGFQRNQRHLHVWSVDQTVVNAYLLWALSQSDTASGESSRTDQELALEIDALQNVALTSQDPYLVALSAITLGNVGRDAEMKTLLVRLAAMQQSDGRFLGQTTITQSGGRSLAVETTALAILALGRSDAHRLQTLQAATWLMQNRQSGGFGSTQATVLALKALILLHDRIAGGDGGNVEVRLNDQVVDTIQWQGQSSEGVRWELPNNITAAMVTDPHTKLTLRTDHASTLPYTLVINGRTSSPASDPGCPIALQLSFAGQSHTGSVAGGDAIEVVAEIRNTTADGRPMTVAVIGLPGGLEPVIESLDKQRDDGLFDYYELRGREIILYWRTFAPHQMQRVAITCTAAIGGRYTAPPSCAYLYYTAESKTWHPPLQIEIQ